MNATIQRIIDICKQRKIPVSKLEKDLGFSNGYLKPTRQAELPYDRLAAISDYLQLPVSYLVSGEMVEEESPQARQIERLLAYNEAYHALIDSIPKLQEKDVQLVVDIINRLSE